jgi:hypothetical protein
MLFPRRAFRESFLAGMLLIASGLVELFHGYAAQPGPEDSSGVPGGSGQPVSLTLAAVGGEIHTRSFRSVCS